MLGIKSSFLWQIKPVLKPSKLEKYYGRACNTVSSLDIFSLLEILQSVLVAKLLTVTLCRFVHHKALEKQFRISFSILSLACRPTNKPFATVLCLPNLVFKIVVSIDKYKYFVNL